MSDWEHDPTSGEREEPFGNFAFSRDWHGLFRIEPENLIAVKAPYWLPL